jgi:predicted nuclease of predicted toxin-antitoxin system
MPLRFHLDENASGSLAKALRRRNIDVTTTPEQGQITASDDSQLALAHAGGRVLITFDSDFVRMSAAGAPHRGIVFGTNQQRPLRELVDRIVIIWRTLTPAEMVGQVQFV